MTCITLLDCPLTKTKGMEAPLPRKAITTTVTRQVSFQIRSTARTLGDLATALSVDWDKMEDAERLALMRKVRQLAVDLGHLAERNGEPGPPTTDPETGLHWVDGLLFLTPREYEVLQALALGASTTRIGELLGISPSTVRSYVKSILAKLGVHSRIEAVSVLLTGTARLENPA